MNSQIPLEVIGLRKAYHRRPILRDVSFRLNPGDAMAVVGPNGAGKSTLLGCLTGDRLPDGGEVRACGHDPFEDPVSTARCMGFVPEQPFLYGELRVGEMLGFVVSARGLDSDEGHAEIERLLALLGLAGADSVLCRELSQGMGRKVAIISALLHRPALLVLDEVMNGLDLTSAEGLLEELTTRRAEGAAVMLSSHDLELLGRWCNRGLLLAPVRDPRLLTGRDWQRWSEQPTLAAEGI
ncbi:MAG TPA: ABC transporter ATP-binding protein [Longimicrobiaceae bacterium]|nr:ABC transporter ATP-binding protein [Longimicrobiaceae bacterium]